jgi:hypothetical protein
MVLILIMLILLIVIFYIIVILYIMVKFDSQEIGVGGKILLFLDIQVVHLPTKPKSETQTQGNPSLSHFYFRVWNMDHSIDFFQILS